MGKKTIQDVANKAGVSITTVSRVINKNYPVKESTRIIVEKVIKDMNFKPNMLAKSLIQKNTKTIGILTPSIENLFFSEVVKGIDDVMRKNGFTSFLCHTEGDPKLEIELINSLQNRQVDGIIMIDPRRDNVESGVIEDIADKIPLLLINGYSKDIKCNYVLNDSRTGTLDALNNLYNSGCSNIAFLRGGKSFSYDEKEETYREFMFSKSLSPSIISINDGNDLKSVDMAKEAVLIKLNSEYSPDGIFCCNDWMAVGALNAAKTLNIPVPSRLRITGFDNTIISQITDPKLSTVDQQMSRLGELAANRITAMIKNSDSENQKIYLETKFIQRES